MSPLPPVLVLIVFLACRAAAQPSNRYGSASQPSPSASPARTYGSASTGAPTAPVDQLIPWLLGEDSQLRGIAWSEVVFDATGKKVVPFNPKDETDQRVLKAITAACDETIRRLNAADSPIQKIDRINEVSSHFEETLRELINSAPGIMCDFPRTAKDKVQRSGYPDLRIVDGSSGRVFYLDPKLYAQGSRESSFRTFYFEPKVATNKIRDDAVHFIVGFEHEASASLRRTSQPSATKNAIRPATEDNDSLSEPRDVKSRLPSAIWRFTRWDLVDLSKFKVKLKAEFQGSNRDMYRPEAIVASSAK